MPRLILVFAGRTHFVGFVMSRLIYFRRVIHKNNKTCNFQMHDYCKSVLLSTNMTSTAETILIDGSVQVLKFQTFEILIQILFPLISHI